jgi:Domain of unknown function (DUF397)
MSGNEGDSVRGWRRPSRSYGSGNCVEVSGLSVMPDHISVRDSKNPGPVLQLTRVGWTAFLGHVRSGKLPSTQG